MARRKRKEKKDIHRGIGIKKPLISLCMIAKNEEGYIKRCIESVREVVDEIIVVDTGSEDTTATIARNLGARVYDYEWNNDFSEARNFSLEHASGDWILVLDADEAIAPTDAEKIRNLAEGNAAGYLFTYRSYSNESNDIRWETNDGSYKEGAGWDGWISGKVVRLFRNEPRIRFQGTVHESVESSIMGSRGKIGATDIIIHHFHETKGKEKLREKQLQYLRLCEKNLKKFPNNPKTYFDMGLVYGYMLKDHRRAISHYAKAIRLDRSFEDARVALAFSYHYSGGKEQTTAEISTILARNPDCAPALLLCGIILEEKGRTERAIECYERAARLNPNLIDARVNLGALLFKKGDFERARSEWKSAHGLNPSNVRALLNLGALKLRDGSHESAQRLFEKALEHAPDNALLWNNMGAVHASRGNLEEAREAFEKALEFKPGYTDARRNLEAIRNRTAAAV